MRRYVAEWLALAVAAIGLCGCWPTQVGSSLTTVAERPPTQAGSALPTVAAEPPRQVLVAADVTLGAKLLPALRRVLEGVLDALGPGDQIVLVRLPPGRFVPSRDVIAAENLPALDVSELAPALTMDQWRQRQARLAGLRRDLRARKATLLAALDRLLAPPPKGARGTQVHDVLRYLAGVPALAGAQRIVIVLSDLYEQDAQGRNGDQRPPQDRLALDSADVRLLFVPDTWRAGSSGAAWTEWLSRCGAARSELCDAGLSAGARPLARHEPPVSVPRVGF